MRMDRSRLSYPGLVNDESATDIFGIPNCKERLFTLNGTPLVVKQAERFRLLQVLSYVPFTLVLSPPSALGNGCSPVLGLWRLDFELRLQNHL